MNTSTHQRTLKNVIRATGVGLHSGAEIKLTLRPAPPDHGIVFVRTDLEPAVRLPACIDRLGGTHLATSLTDGRATVAAVEHLMAAFCGLGIDNVRVEVDAAELPIMDGSASPFVFLLQAAGIATQPAPRRFLRILEPVTFADGPARATLEPWDGMRVEYTLEYDHPGLRGQRRTAAVDVDRTRFVREIARARTFGFLSDRDRMKGMNAARPGGTPGAARDNVVLLDDCAVSNGPGLRFADEFVMHRILDAIGDLYLLGHPLIGAFRGFRSGHGTNAGLLRALLAERAAWELVTFETPAELPGALGRTIPEIA